MGPLYIELRAQELPFLEVADDTIFVASIY
jgi:hypothetical protein